jgi:hypothetical protein
VFGAESSYCRFDFQFRILHSNRTHLSVSLLLSTATGHALLPLTVHRLLAAATRTRVRLMLKCSPRLQKDAAPHTTPPCSTTTACWHAPSPLPPCLPLHAATTCVHAMHSSAAGVFKTIWTLHTTARAPFFFSFSNQRESFSSHHYRLLHSATARRFTTTHPQPPCKMQSKFHLNP